MGCCGDGEEVQEGDLYSLKIMNFKTALAGTAIAIIGASTLHAPAAKAFSIGGLMNMVVPGVSPHAAVTQNDRQMKMLNSQARKAQQIAERAENYTDQMSDMHNDILMKHYTNDQYGNLVIKPGHEEAVMNEMAEASRRLPALTSTYVTDNSVTTHNHLTGDTIRESVLVRGDGNSVNSGNSYNSNNANNSFNNNTINSNNTTYRSTTINQRFVDGDDYSVTNYGNGNTTNIRGRNSTVNNYR